jgi:hypothetical protein
MGGDALNIKNSPNPTIYKGGKGHFTHEIESP